MSRILRFLGFDDTDDQPSSSPALAAIENELGGLAPERAQYIAAFAFLLARVADADLEVEDRERGAMQRMLVEHAGLSDHEAGMVSELAVMRSEELAGTANIHVSRLFRDISQPAQRLQLIECVFAVAAADDDVSIAEGNEVFLIGEELGVSRNDVLAIRARHRDQLAEFKKLRTER